MNLAYPLDNRFDLPPAELTELIGGKAANLALMVTELGLPVPPGFAITTEACNEFLAGGWPAGLDGEIATSMRALESRIGRRFGDDGNPLLVSVRSGAPVSMPGMMDTILNLGLNEKTVRGLAAMSGDAAFAGDCKRRFEEMFTRVVGVHPVPDDPWRQLRDAVEAVFRSWNSERARAYREREGIADDLGTAVTVQAMVFGNLGVDSATGVLFTRNPATGERALYGDVLFAAQGEDVVAGTHLTQSLDVLDSRLPKVGAELRRVSETLERHFADLCDIEFTIEQGRLWLLQVRVGKRSPQAALRMAVDMAEDADFPLTRNQAVERVAAILAHPPLVSTGLRGDASVLATGLPASPGVASGEIATSPGDAIAVADAGRPVILVRSETAPEDVPGMARAAGVLTSRGGLVSHAAVVARGWGIPAVVGAEMVEVGRGEVKVGDRVLRTGDTITIDGGTGEIFAGTVGGGTAIAPEVATLLAWARELGIEIGPSKAAGIAGADAEPANADGVVRALLVKGSAPLEGVPAAVLEPLVAGGLVESRDGGYRLTPAGRTRGQALLASERQRWGPDRAVAALEAFPALDHRMKETITAWQLRDVEGRQELNDHSDAAYDAGVLVQLADLHRDAVAWLASLTGAPTGLLRYVARLDRALGGARGGDHRFVASPRVDSYHSVWFELHEELILLAGRSRADEAAAGRA